MGACPRPSRPCRPAAGNPPRAAGNPGRRIERLLPPGDARWVAAGDLFHQPQERPATGRNIRSRRLTYHEGVPGHHLQISHRAAVGRHPDAAQDRLLLAYTSKAGRFIRSSWPTSWAATRDRARRLSPVVPVPRRAAGRRHGSQHQAAGPANRRSITCRDHRLRRAAASQREVERYCISTGQACSYKIGHLAWLRAREKAKAILGAKFDIKQFHEVLKDGAMPLTILERRVEERARAQA